MVRPGVVATATVVAILTAACPAAADRGAAEHAAAGRAGGDHEEVAVRPPAAVRAAAAVRATATARAADPPHPARTPWRGWEVAGAPRAIGSIERIAAAGTTVMGVADGTPRRLVLERPDGTHVGTLPPGRTAMLAGPGRIVAVDGCTVHRSDDLGGTWRRAALPDCSPDTALQPVAFADAEHGLVLAGQATWGTDDGGGTWTRRGPGTTTSTPGLLVAGTRLAFRTSTAGEGRSLERSSDGGATWRGIPLPPAPPLAPPDGGPSTAPATPTLPTATPLPDGALPTLSAPALRGDGAIVVGTTGAVLVSTDGGGTFARVPLPPPPGGFPEAVDRLACAPGASSCLVGTASGRAHRLTPSGLATTPLSASLPMDPIAPTPGVVVGLGVRSGSTLVRSDDDGASYTSYEDAWAVSPASRPGLLVLAAEERLRLSTDAGGSWTDVPAPPSGRVDDLVRAGGGDGLVALAQGGLATFAGGRWSATTDVGALQPSAVAIVRGRPVLAGGRGIARVVGGRLRALSARVLDGRAYAGIVARGDLVVAWSREQVVRSTDAGAHWSAARGVPGVDDV